MAVDKTPDHKVAAASAALKQEAFFGAALLRRHGWRLLLVFAGLLLPLWGFAELADEIHEQEAIPFDEPLLRLAHALGSAGYDRVFIWISGAGYLHGVVPFDIALVLVLTLLRRFREATFAAVALGGAALLNVAAKHAFARIRPALWDSISPETTFSFPSGHAMGSATLACVLVALAWGTRWRWPVVALAAAFVFAVGLSRVYLGVHYPSDILAGWAAATAWALASYLVVFRSGARPWVTNSNTAP
jgi:undecaprenyl-diphosphatase